MEMSKISNKSNIDNDTVNKTDLNNSLNELLGSGKNLTILSYNCEAMSIHTSSHTDTSNLVQLIEENKYKFIEDNNESNICDILKTANFLNIDGLRRIITQKLYFDYNNSEGLAFEVHKHSAKYKEDDDSCYFNIEDPFGIISRPKHSKLSHSQIKFLKSIIDKNKEKLTTISQTYEISLSTLSKIKNTNNEMLEELPRRNFSKLNQREATLVKDAIEEYYLDQDLTITIKDIQKSIESKENISCSYQQVRKIMIEDSRLSYKRCLSRPIIVNMNKVKLMRKLFSLQITQELNSDSLLVNWDEWSINRHTKQNYSWPKIGTNKEVKNSIFSGSSPIIMSIFSNECWFAMISNATTNTQVFFYFLNRMIEWLIKNNKFGFKNINLILDNCPYHKSKEAIKNMQKLPIKIYFLPPYSPSLAPIELMFGWIKKIINKKSKWNEN